MDNRQLTDTLCDGRTLNVNPDVIADFRDMPFPDESFYLVVFDPPHLINAGQTKTFCHHNKRLKSWPNYHFLTSQ